MSGKWGQNKALVDSMGIYVLYNNVPSASRVVSFVQGWWESSWVANTHTVDRGSVKGLYCIPG